MVSEMGRKSASVREGKGRKDIKFIRLYKANLRTGINGNFCHGHPLGRVLKNRYQMDK